MTSIRTLYGIALCALLFVVSCSLFTTNEFRAEDREVENVAPARLEAQKALGKLCVIGASQSDGFGCGVKLGDVLDKAVSFEHKVKSYSDSMFFRRPRATGKKQIDTLLASDSTTVMAVDYLFWYVYGHHSRKSRVARIGEALANLDSFPGNIFVGDIPNMEGANKMMLPASAVPSVADLAVVNKVIKKWVSERKRVTLLPLAQWVEILRSGGEVTLNGKMIKVESSKVMSWDKLHANLRGQALLSAMILDQVRQTLPALAPEDLNTDLEQLHELALKRRKEILDAPLKPEPAAPEPAAPEQAKPDSSGLKPTDPKLSRLKPTAKK